MVPLFLWEFVPWRAGHVFRPTLPFTVLAVLVLLPRAFILLGIQGLFDSTQATRDRVLRQREFETIVD